MGSPCSIAAARAARLVALASLAVWGCGGEGTGDEPAATVNECAMGSFVDGSRDGGVVRIAFGDELGHNYEPPCVRVVAGDVVRFEGPFDTHPLVPGRIEDGMPSTGGPGGSANPVPEVLGGQTAEFVAERPGRFGYYCDLHVAEGMIGAIEVIAAPGAGDAR